MSYNDCFRKYKEVYPFASTYEFTIMLASHMSSQKALMYVENIKDNVEELDSYSRLLFDIVKNKEISLNYV